MLIFVLYSKYIAKNSVTKIFGYGFLVVVTGSMEPEIEQEELIVIKEFNEYNVGDIVTYETDGYLVTHRIVQINNDEIITKGDSNNEEDLKISKNQIVGKVIYHSKALRKICYLLFKSNFNIIYNFCYSNLFYNNTKSQTKK